MILFLILDIKLFFIKMYSCKLECWKPVFCSFPKNTIEGLPNAEAIVAVHEGNPLYIELPASVALTITYTEPGIQGDRSSGGTKPATVETGIEIQVPLFIKQDEKVLVDTRDGSYQGRA